MPFVATNNDHQKSLFSGQLHQAQIVHGASTNQKLGLRRKRHHKRKIKINSNKIFFVKYHEYPLGLQCHKESCQAVVNNVNQAMAQASPRQMVPVHHFNISSRNVLCFESPNLNSCVFSLNLLIQPISQYSTVHIQ